MPKNLREPWTEKSRQAWMTPAAVPDDAIAPYFVAAPTEVEMNKAMNDAGWLRTSAYGPFVAPDGNHVRIAYNMAVLRQRETEHIINAKDPDAPHGTLFVVWPPTDDLQIGFHKDRARMVDYAIKHRRWVVRDLPTRT